MNPVGLTTSEEEKERAPTSPAAPQPKAPPGTASCRIVVLPGGDVCGAVATLLIVWSRDPEADKTPACLECAGRMREVARSFGSDVKLEST